MDYAEFQAHLEQSRLGCTAEVFTRLQEHLCLGGSPAPSAGIFVEAGTGQPRRCDSGDILPEGVWLPLGEPAVRELVEQGALSSAIPSTRPY